MDPCSVGIVVFLTVVGCFAAIVVSSSFGGHCGFGYHRADLAYAVLGLYHLLHTSPFTLGAAV